jgi:hypothetical protein
MNRRSLADLIDMDLPLEELERLAHIDALLRLVAAADRRQLGIRNPKNLALSWRPTVWTPSTRPRPDGPA